MDTIKPTEITFDLAKNDANVRGGLYIERAAIHIISLRKANKREERGYAA